MTEKQYSLTCTYSLEEVSASGERVPTGHKVVFTTMPSNLEPALKSWYMTIQNAVGCGSNLEEKALSLLNI